MLLHARTCTYTQVRLNLQSTLHNQPLYDQSDLACCAFCIITSTVPRVDVRGITGMTVFALVSHSFWTMEFIHYTQQSVKLVALYKYSLNIVLYMLEYSWPNARIKDCSASQIKMSHSRFFLKNSSAETFPSCLVNGKHRKIESSFFPFSFLSLSFAGLSSVIPQRQRWHSER